MDSTYDLLRVTDLISRFTTIEQCVTLLSRLEIEVLLAYPSGVERFDYKRGFEPRRQLPARRRNAAGVDFLTLTLQTTSNVVISTPGYYFPSLKQVPNVRGHQKLSYTIEY